MRLSIPPSADYHSPSQPDTTDYTPKVESAHYSTQPPSNETNSNVSNQSEFSRMLEKNAPEKKVYNEVAYSPSEAERYKDAPYNPTVTNEDNYAQSSSHTGLYVGLLALAIIFVLAIVYHLK